MKIRKTRSAAIVSVGLSMLLALSGCGGEEASGGESENFSGTLDLALGLGEGSHQHVGAQAFGDKLEELTDGRIKVKYHYNSSLGGEREVIEGMSINSIDMAVTSTGPMGGFVKDFFIFDLPYLFESREHAYAVLDSEIGAELGQKFEDAAGVKVLAWTENGLRHHTNGVRPVRTAEDLKGLKHRTQESEVQIDTWKALGTNPTPISWPELYTALQQGVVESQENPLPTMFDVKFYEVQNHLTMTQHVYGPAPIQMSKQLFDSFSESDQQAVLEAAEHALPIQRESSIEQEKKVLSELEALGMEIVEDPDLETFREAVEPVYEKWAPEIGEELIDQIRNFDH